MKSLDEVIKKIEKQWVCPSSDEADEYCELYDVRDDAIHYLKEYRSEKAMWEADRKGLLDWIEQYKESREKHQQAVIELKKNPPLDWETLKQMEGKPVWIEDHGRKEWVIINHAVDEDTKYERLYIQGFYPRSFFKHDHQWQAYRKERE